MKKETAQTIKTIILALIVAATANLVSANWTSPPSNPPSGNVDAPINVGAATQQKLGPLWVNTNTTGNIAAVGLSVWGNSDKPIRIVDSNLTSGTPTNHDGWVLTSDQNGYGSWKSITAATQPHGFVSLPVGSGNWTVPANVTSIDVDVIGGGGGGWWEGGTGAGYTHKFMTVTPGSTIAYTVGAGGHGTGPYVVATNNCTYGSAVDGGQSTFAGTIIAYGGQAGYSSNGGSQIGGGWSGGDIGAYGWDPRTMAYPPLSNWGGPGDRNQGFPSGYPLSRGDFVMNNSQGTPTRAATYGGGGFGDRDGGGGVCGGAGADGAIFIKY